MFIYICLSLLVYIIIIIIYDTYELNIYKYGGCRIMKGWVYDCDAGACMKSVEEDCCV